MIKVKTSKLLSACILSVLTCTTMGAVSAATYPLTEDTLGGTYENLEKQHFLRIDGDRVIKATEYINFKSSSKLEDTSEDTSWAIIEGYSKPTEGTLTVDMQDHNLKVGPYGSLVQIYNWKNKINNKHLIITNADTVESVYGKGNLILIKDEVNNSSVTIDANNIVMNKVNEMYTYPVLSIGGNNVIDLRAKDDVLINTMGRDYSNIINANTQGTVNITAGNDISLNGKNIDSGPLVILDGESKASLQSGRDLRYNNTGSNHILLRGRSKISSQAGRNIVFNNDGIDRIAGNINMIIAGGASEGRFIADKEIRFTESKLGVYPIISVKENSELTLDSEDFSVMHIAQFPLLQRGKF